MLIAKGNEVSFKLVGGSEIFAPATYSMLHDPTGEDWPADSVLVAPLKSKGRNELDYPEAEDYFGAPPLEGKFELPSKNLKAWKSLGEVSRIDYSRKRPLGLFTAFKGDYRHEFDGTEGAFGFLFHVFEAAKPVLFKCGRMLRLELPFGASLNERGFIWP